MQYLFVFFILSSPAFAVLGESETSIEKVRQHYNGEALQSPQTFKTYSRNSFKSPDGFIIREFINPSGQVFAVAWKGPAHPDLSLLMGQYFDEVRVKNREPHQARKPYLRRQTENVVITKWGHMSDLHGYAIIPSLTPPGVLEKEIHE